jgi:biopolymer transport protein ExbD
MNFAGTRRKREPVQLDLTPLIDVVFLLLIFFLVTAAYANGEQTVIPVELPQGTSGDASPEDEQVTIVVRGATDFVLQTASGATALEGDAEALRVALEAIHEASPGASVFLRGDRSVSYGTVMEVLDVARTIGFPRVFNVIEE